MTEYPSRKLDQFVLRLPEGMRERIRAASELTGRSMNSEIVHALEKAFPKPTEIERLTAALLAAVAEYESGGGPDSQQKALAAILDLQSLIEAERHEFGSGANELYMREEP